MIKIKNKDQLFFSGFEEWQNMYSGKKLKILQKSWAGVFREHILPSLPVKKILKYYSNNRGRPSKEIYSTIGAVVLQQFFNLTDEETISELAFNQQWHFALECFSEEDQVISLRTFWAMRDQLLQSDLIDEIFASSVDKFVHFFDVDVSRQRLDSVHVYSNMARLGRVKILLKTITKFLRNLKKRHRNIFDKKISSELIENYLEKSDDSYFGQIKPSETKHRLQTLAEDMYSLKMRFKNEKKVSRLASFKLLKRVFDEHCFVKENNIFVKPSKEIRSDSVQNPSDPDAGYDGHKGQGYQTQIMETYTKAKEKSENPNLDLITYVKTESADKHDSHAFEPAIKDISDRKENCEIVLADTSYGSNENVEKGEKYGVKLIAPIPGKSSDNKLNNFEFNNDNPDIISCQNNKKPDEIRHNKKASITAIWYKSTCANCPYGNTCPTEKCKIGRRIYYTEISVKSYRRRKYEESDEFEDEYRYRSGIEATNSRFIHMTSARRSRYRGLKKMRFGQKLKALAINVFRIVKYLEKLTDYPKFSKFFINYIDFYLESKFKLAFIVQF